MKKQFISEVLNKLPHYRLVGGSEHGYFCEFPFGHILRGFVYEKKRYSTSVWKFIYPLFDRSQHVHLGYSELLTQTLEDTDNKSSPQTFVDFIEPHLSSISSLYDLNAFIAYFEKSVCPQPYQKRGYAMALILAGRATEAIYHLKLLANNDAHLMQDEFKNDLLTLLHEAESNIDDAIRTIMKWENEKKKMLDI